LSLRQEEIRPHLVSSTRRDKAITQLRNYAITQLRNCSIRKDNYTSVRSYKI
jgi:hypothetical protein